MKRNHLAFLLIIISTLVGTCGQALADDAWLLTPAVGYHWFDKALQLDSAPQYGLRIAYSLIGKGVTDSLEVEGEFDYVSTRSKDGTRESANVYVARVNALYPFLPRKQLVPYAVIGLGGIFVSGPHNDDQDPLLSYGVTVRYYLSERMALGADFRNTLVYRDGFEPDFEAVVGLTFVIGGEQKFKRLPVPKTKVPTKPTPVIKPLEELEEDGGEGGGPVK